MITYVVQQGDSLYSIAQRFGVTVDALMEANRLTSTIIYVGQTLTIPVSRQRTYTVQAGDSLYSIAQRFGTTYQAIMILNGLTSTALQIGQRLRIPVYTEAIVNVNTANIRQYPGTTSPLINQMDRGARLPVTGIEGDWVRVQLYDGRVGWVLRDLVRVVPHGGERPVLQVLGFYTEREGPTLPSSYQVFVEHTAQLSAVGMFHFRINRANPTEIEKFPATFTDAYMRQVVDHGHRHNVKMLPTVHNLLYERGNQEANKEVIRGMLATPDTRRAFISSVIALIQRYNFDGVNIDFEDVRYEDRERLSAFYRELGSALRNQGYFYSVDTPSRTSDEPTNPFSAPFNYAVIGEAVDEFVVMLYNEHGWPGSGPGPVVSIGWMERVIRYALTKMPASKITAAVSVFGFDFNLTTGRNTYATYSMAMNLARRYNKDVIFDERTQTPMFAYTDESGNRHEVWFENAASIRAKMQLAHRLGIRGIALWRLGMEDPGMWTMMENEFVIRKSAT
ncbi:LysM peptidoglycan-binding domain-containing protein [Paenibacillus ehimensis]|uniref:LysM peptidoglycan-binding domain-containing protein n=1 Tax=Paenibacillus ehimensis TaxID=79264 RepID=A0ABT8VAH8_9BACL|nr:LysM peptidoglycan-binding domain-containing protein [Paenibacillus ehimensis]MDO3677973.1 LysM peptidoglycan-binding domain-containing protein [Paenibacillus ehimensis]MEC0210843.1 LysM peptidoglycan-binding domain-containing protein [Paenibacillus ehimensis]